MLLQFCLPKHVPAVGAGDGAEEEIRGLAEIRGLQRRVGRDAGGQQVLLHAPVEGAAVGVGEVLVPCRSLRMRGPTVASLGARSIASSPRDMGSSKRRVLSL